MKNIQTEKLKYGIGITADYSPLALSTRTFSAQSVSVPGKTSDISPLEPEIGIIDHPLFSFLHTEIQDYILLEVDTLEENITILIEAISETAGVYLRIVVPPGTNVTIHESLIPTDVLGAIIDVQIGAGAHVTYIADQRAGYMTATIALRRAFVGKDARIRFIDLCLVGAITNSSIYTLLDEPGSHADIYGAFFGTDSQLIDISHTTIHRAAHTSSDLKTHGALDKKAKGIFRSLINIRENAPHTSGHQKEETLLLSRDAQISSVPDLEIANNEVSCSHGVSTTNVDDESLFYFHSRGMDTETAKQTIVEGHLDAIVDMVSDEALKNDIKRTIQNRIRIKQVEQIETNWCYSV